MNSTIAKMLIILGLFFISGLFNDASADTIGLHLRSVHSVKGFNDNNPGMYYRADNGATAGFYCNSESKSKLFPNASTCKLSTYAGYTVSAEIGPVEVAATVGVITGYERGTMPLVLPTISTRDEVKILNLNIGKPRVAFVPAIDPKRGAHVVHFMLEKKF